MDVEVTCAIMVSEGVDGTDVSQEGPPTLLYHEVDSKINNLNPNGVYQFRVVAQVTIRDSCTVEISLHQGVPSHQVRRCWHPLLSLVLTVHFMI